MHPSSTAHHFNQKWILNTFYTFDNLVGGIRFKIYYYLQIISEFSFKPIYKTKTKKNKNQDYIRNEFKIFSKKQKDKCLRSITKTKRKDEIPIHHKTHNHVVLKNILNVRTSLIGTTCIHTLIKCFSLSINHIVNININIEVHTYTLILHSLIVTHTL